MIVINEAEDSIVVHSREDLNPVANTDYLKAIQICGASNLVVEKEEKQVSKSERPGHIDSMSD